MTPQTLEQMDREAAEKHYAKVLSPKMAKEICNAVDYHDASFFAGIKHERERLSGLKLIILEVLKSYEKDMENYGYFGANMGVSEDDYEEIADKVVSRLTANDQAKETGK